MSFAVEATRRRGDAELKPALRDLCVVLAVHSDTERLVVAVENIGDSKLRPSPGRDDWPEWAAGKRPGSQHELAAAVRMPRGFRYSGHKLDHSPQGAERSERPEEPVGDRNVQTLFHQPEKPP